MMDIYILRHAVAVSREEYQGQEDASRPLTPKGEKEMRKAAKGMKEMGVEFDLLLSSPYLRCVQTAEIVNNVFKRPVEIEFSKHLKPEGASKELMEEINRKYRARRSLLLVGHEPYLSALITLWLGGFENMAIELKKGGLCKLTANRLTHGRCATLEWLLTPRQLMKLRR
jgi:phosphohistidine phosphatase